ncbi:UPF0280 family protein [Variovorax dokdonensis]|uniref:UPF0280 family protein n=1 Tax=Variovorax dokdonensis TaxID=344883 RepID=A0ABT7NFC7_9BURK|nr:UPF0280 family protein [Variovorax dokdonensis]MDM0046644.1 UPF0280 family protein [Variovorax dokdonensis]
MSARRTPLDGDPLGRWHFQHGPIDIVAQAEGDPRALARAHEATWLRFETILDELVGELRLLRRPVAETKTEQAFRGPIARRMWLACEAASAPLGHAFITPMAAVAGSVAQELIASYDMPGIERAWINNGGDIALHLAPGRSARVGVFADLSRFDLRDAGPLAVDGSFEIHAAMPVRGVATSGWRGRSFSLGIADSVTVLAASASQADAAATLIANAVDVNDAAIRRLPASQCKDDSDLGDLPVTVDVAPLAPEQVRRALEAGMQCAIRLQQAGVIHSAVLACQGQWRIAEAGDGPSMLAQPGSAALPSGGSSEHNAAQRCEAVHEQNIRRSLHLGSVFA